jgi:hypothetical protein
MHRFRLILASAVALIAGMLVLALSHQRTAAAQGSCGATTYSATGVSYRVLFARNGAVQQYQLAHSSHNTEKDHDVLKDVQQRYGPEGVNAPPLRITSFRPGSGGMMIPDKAVDSCGRTITFH